MKIERTKNAVRGIITGVILKVYQIIVPFAMRTLIIVLLGVEYLGLNSLFSSILQTLNLVELGVGSAMTYAMYKPIADNDTSTINALIRLYKLYYRVIGSVILILGCFLTPIIPRFIAGDVPKDINIYVLYFINLITTVLSYWLFAYRNSILQAHQRLDLINNVTIITDTLKYILQISMLLLFKNYYIYIIIVLFSQVFTNILTAWISYRYFPNYKAEGKLERKTITSINNKIRDLFTAKLGGVIVNSADTIVVSAFMGLTVVAIYQNYYFILTSLIGILTIVFNSCIAGIGNSLIVESKEKNYADLKRFSFIIAFLIQFCAASLLCLYQPFMELWVGKELMLPFPIVICFVLYFIVYEFNMLFNTFKDAAGMWHEDRFRPLVTASCNLIMNLLTVKVLGLYGIILSTVVSFVFIGIPWILNNIFKTIFERKNLKEYLLFIMSLVVEILVFCILTYGICISLPFNGLIGLCVRALVCMTIPIILFLIVNNRKIELLYLIETANRITKGLLFKIKAVSNFYNNRIT